MMLDRHLHEGMVQQVLHGEVGRDERAGVDAHLASCAACRGAVTEAREEERKLFSRLRSLDHPVPRRSLTLVGHTVPATSRVTPLLGRLAAGVVLAAALGGVAYAAPGSPVPGLLRRLGHALAPAWVGDSGERAAAVSSDSTAGRPGPSAPAFSGISVEPGARFSIDFPDASPGGTVIVSIGDGTELLVTAASNRTSFSSGSDRLTVATPDSASTVEIAIPRTAPDVEIRFAGHRVFHKLGNRTITTPSAGRDGRFRLRLDPSPPGTAR